MFVDRSQRLPIPEGVSDHTVEALSDKLREGIDAATQIRQIQLGREATQLWTADLYDEFTEADDEDRAEAEFTRRAAPYCLRVAGLLAALESRALIGAADLGAAAALIRYSIASARYVLDRQARNPRLDRIRRAVDAAGQAGLSRTQVSALFSRNITRQLLDELLAELTSDDEYEESQMATRGRPAIRYRRRVVSSYFVPIDSNRTENGSDPNQLPGGPAKTAKPLSPDGARGLEPQGDDEGDERRRKKDTGRADSNHDSEEPQAGAADAESAASSAAGWLAQRDPAAPEVKPPCEHEVCFDALLGRCLAESDSAGLSDEQFEEVLAGAKAEGDLSRASVDRKATAVKADSSPEGTVSQNAKAPDIEPEAATCGCAAVLGPFGGHYPGCAAEAAS